MTIKVCEIEYREEGKLVEAIFKVGFKNNLKVDVCEKHQNWVKKFKTPDELFQGLINIGKKVPTATVEEAKLRPFNQKSHDEAAERGKLVRFK